MDNDLLESLAWFLFFCFYAFVAIRFCYLSWFRFPRLLAMVIRNFRWWNGSFARSKGFFAAWGKKIILHWSYKWQARITSTFMLFPLIAFLVAMIIYVVQIFTDNKMP